jgi:tetratricopeptide (TPR) repeat protein
MTNLLEFFSQSKVLIIDSHLASRVAVRQSLMELGAQASHIVCTKTLADARHALTQHRVSLVIAEYILEDGIGTSILTSPREFLFLLLSSNNSRAAIAKAAEDEVDEFLFKPYNQQDFKSVLEQMVLNWMNPSEYERALTDGRSLLEQNNIDLAAICFEKAKQDRRTYSRACGYLGQIERTRTSLAAAARQFEEGLDSNGLHFRCLNGLYQTYFQQNRLADAYRILKEIVVNFPENPERLSAAVHLAVRTDNLRDIEIYYSVFGLMTQKTPDSIKHLCSALSVAGHYHLRKKNTIQAMLSFERALTVSMADPKYIDYISQKLLTLGLNQECERLLGQFKAS